MSVPFGHPISPLLREGDGAILAEWKLWVPCHLPWAAIGIGEVSRIATPGRFDARLQDGPSTGTRQRPSEAVAIDTPSARQILHPQCPETYPRLIGLPENEGAISHSAIPFGQVGSALFVASYENKRSG